METLRTKDGVRYESVQKYGFYERSVITVVDKTKCLSLRIQRIALTVRDPETGKLVVKRTIAPLPNILLRRYQYSPALIDVVLNVYLADKYPDIWGLPICDRSIIDMLADPDWRKCVSADVLSIIEELFCSDTNVMSNPKAENRYARVMIRMQSPRFIARLKVTLARLRLDITDFDSIVKCFNDEKKPEEIARKLQDMSIGYRREDAKELARCLRNKRLSDEVVDHERVELSVPSPDGKKTSTVRFSDFLNKIVFGSAGMNLAGFEGETAGASASAVAANRASGNNVMTAEEMRKPFPFISGDSDQPSDGLPDAETIHQDILQNSREVFSRDYLEKKLSDVKSWQSRNLTAGPLTSDERMRCAQNPFELARWLKDKSQTFLSNVFMNISIPKALVDCLIPVDAPELNPGSRYSPDSYLKVIDCFSENGRPKPPDIILMAATSAA